MRTEFVEALTNKMQEDSRYVVLTGDVGAGMFDMVAISWPERFLNVGICEQTMVGIAAGMAIEGFVPVVFTRTPFLIERALEQIKIDIIAMGRCVKLVGDSTDSGWGSSHECVLRSYPGLCRCDSVRELFASDTCMFLEIGVKIETK